MKRLTLIILCLVGTRVLAQTCISGFLVLNSQAEIDNFPSDYPDCIQILGMLIIDESVGGNITNLDSLIQIERIGGDLRIMNNSSLNDLSGLTNLVYIGGHFNVDNNGALNNLNGMISLDSVGGFIQFRNNASLSSLLGLEGLLHIGGDLVFENNDVLTDISALSNISSLGGLIAITENAQLSGLSGLDGITEFDFGIFITYNDALSDISSLAGVNMIASDFLEIVENPNLTDCAIQSFCNYLDLPMVMPNIQINDFGCNSVAEVEAACSPLPIEWSKPLDVVYVDDQVCLNWAAINQISNAYFIIERSENGLHYQSIGSIDRVSFHVDEMSYEFHDKFPFYGMNYYRVKQVDVNGEFGFSNVASVNIDHEILEVHLFPNPANDEISIGSNYQGSVQIFNCFGQIIITKQLNSFSTSINVGSLTGGVYFLVLENGESTSFIIDKID